MTEDVIKTYNYKFIRGHYTKIIDGEKVESEEQIYLVKLPDINWYVRIFDLYQAYLHEEKRNYMVANEQDPDNTNIKDRFAVWISIHSGINDAVLELYKEYKDKGKVLYAKFYMDSEFLRQLSYYYQKFVYRKASEYLAVFGDRDS